MITAHDFGHTSPRRAEVYFLAKRHKIGSPKGDLSTRNDPV